MPAQEKLSNTEQYLAYLIGGGVTLAIIALLLIGLGTIEDSNITTSLLLVGLALIVFGVGAWLALIRPWEGFDDLKTPYFTGQHEHAAHAVDEPATPEAQPDNFTLIEGIGPKTAAALVEAGITTFAQIAALTPDELVGAARAHGARVSKAATWPAQAAQAASADLTALEDAQARIKAGEPYDKLTQIEGVGPKSQEALYAAGIRTYQDVAAATPDELRAALETGGLKSLVPDTWPEQAGLIVSGDLTKLKELQDKLRGGR